MVEVVPGSLSPQLGIFGKRPDSQPNDALREGDDVLEIPMLVRVEWDAEVTAADAGVTATATPGKAPKESRELEFWCVLGAGRIVS